MSVLIKNVKCVKKNFWCLNVILLKSFPDSLPMFTVLRKFTIPLTLLLETIILG